MLKIILFSLISFALLSCSSSDKSDLAKLDSPLYDKISKSASGDQIQFIGKCSKKISDDLKAEIESTGVSVQTVIDTIFTASGVTESIKKLAAKDFIIILELSVERDLKNSINNN